MDERGEQQESDTDGHAGISDIECREEREVDEVHNSAIQEAVATKQPVEQVADGSAEDQAECHRLELLRCIAEDEDDEADDPEHHDGDQRSRVGQDRKGCTGVESEPQLEEVVDDNDRSISEFVDRPPFGDLVDNNDNRSNSKRRQPVAQTRFAASTVVVAYGRASSRATGIGSPVTSHIPY